MATVIPRKVKKDEAFADWLEKLTDDVGKAAILDRIVRLESGSLGDVEPVTGAPGLYELRIHVGPGYRVYFINVGNTIVLLLCAGIKRTQTPDIKRAKAMLEEIKKKIAAAKKKREEDNRTSEKARKSKLP